MIHDRFRVYFKRIHYFAIVFFILGLNLLQVPAVFAMDECQSEQLNIFSQQEIEFYDGCSCSETSHTANSNGNDVYMIGDSITVLSQNDIKEALPGITIDAISGTWFANEAGGESGVSRISKMTDKPILVFAMGTNGGVTQDDIDKLFSALEGKDVKIILMTLYYNNPGSAKQMTDSNKVITDTAEKNDNVTIMDWYSVASSDPTNILADDTSTEDPNDKDNVHPSNPTGTQKFAETVKKAVDEISTVNVEASVATGDFSIIQSAKNADVSVPYASSNSPPRSDGWHAYWSDTDKQSMLDLLDKFGDLAYQLGRAVGAPYVAILVQMRYEDPNSLCGSNNYWGNLCDPSHAYAGGADEHFRQSGKPVPSNLGEGFIAYANTLTNGMHDQALGISDPKEYLQKIGPTWVNGDPNGPGYESINLMLKSVDALQAVVDSPEGQAIVQKFGNYTGSISGQDCCLTGTSSPYAKSTSTIKWEDGWIVSGISGFNRDSLEDLPQQETWGADYLTDSLSSQHSGKGPNKILLHATEGDSSGGDSVYNIYKGQTSVEGNNGKAVPPHFTIDIKNKKLYQHQSIWKASAGIKSDEEGNGDLTAGIQIEIVGFDNGTTGEWDLTSEENFSDEDWKYLIELLNGINAEAGIPLTSSVDWGEGNGVRMTDLDEFKNYQGILAHKHAPLNDHSDITESVWNRINSALKKYGQASSDICGGGATGDVASFQATVLKFAWPDHHNGPFSAQMPDYTEAVKKPYYHGGCGGNDCGGFVTTLMRESGWDPNYNKDGCNTTCQYNYLNDPANGWTDVTSTIQSNENALPGDVLIYIVGGGHTLVYVGDIPGFNSKMASASYTESCSGSYYRSPMADSVKDISWYINSSGKDYHVFRKTK